MLEVTTLLHQEAHEGIVPACASLYTATDIGRPVTDRQRNTLLFVRSLRQAALGYTTLGVYALMVVDHALIQLGGLGYGSAFNKIRHPRDASLLAALAAKWYEIERKSELTESSGPAGET